MRNGVRKCLRNWKFKQPNFHSPFRSSGYPVAIPNWLTQLCCIWAQNSNAFVPSLIYNYIYLHRTRYLSLSLSVCFNIAATHSADERQSRKLLLFQQFFTRFVLKPRATWMSKTGTRNRGRCIQVFAAWISLRWVTELRLISPERWIEGIRIELELITFYFFYSHTHSKWKSI